MTDMRPTIVPKSDQLNADDLIGGPRSVTITSVSVNPGTEQPVAISFDGDNGKPYKPCKSMCRVMVALWGPDAKEYAGHSMTLYRDPKVKWGGLEVGGIRISHMSHIERDHTMALTETRSSRKPFTVKRLQNSPPLSAPPHAPAEPAPVATTATGDFFSDVLQAAAKEWTPETIQKRAKEMKAILLDHGNDMAALATSWSLLEDDIMTMPQKTQAWLRSVYDAEFNKLEQAA